MCVNKKLPRIACPHQKSPGNSRGYASLIKRASLKQFVFIQSKHFFFFSVSVDGKVPIVQASRYGSYEDVQLLCSCGATDQVDSRGVTAVYAAVVSNSTNVLRALLKRGFSMRHSSCNIVQKAIDIGSIDCIPFCVLNGAPQVHLNMKERTDIPESTMILLQAAGFLTSRDWTAVSSLLSLCRDSFWLMCRARCSNFAHVIDCLSLPTPMKVFLLHGVTLEDLQRAQADVP